MANCVLLIVNNGDVLRNAYASMRDAGYLVMPLNDAAQAVELLKRVSFDVVVADMQTLNWVNGEGRVSKGLSMLLHQTRDTPVVLGRIAKDGTSDFVDLSDPQAVLQRVREAVSMRRPLSSEGDDDSPIFSKFFDFTPDSGTCPLQPALIK